MNFQKNLMQQMQWRNLLGQQLGANGNMPPGKQNGVNDLGEKQQDKDGHDLAQQKASAMPGGEEQPQEAMADQLLKQSMAQTQEDKKDGIGKKQKDAKSFAQMVWTDQSTSDALKKLTEQLKNSGAAD
jgi:hypothetical protein